MNKFKAVRFDFVKLHALMLRKEVVNCNWSLMCDVNMNLFFISKKSVNYCAFILVD